MHVHVVSRQEAGRKTCSRESPLQQLTVYKLCIGTYTVSKNNCGGISWRYTEYKLDAYYC